jgi:hypothetical protein
MLFANGDVFDGDWVDDIQVRQPPWMLRSAGDLLSCAPF